MAGTEGGAGLTEEPQDERGAPGSRDQGGGPGAGDRPVGTSDARDSSSVDPQEPPDDAPTMHSGDG